MKTIEDVLNLDQDEISRRVTELKRTIPTKPGKEFIKTQLKRFEVQPWPFVSYMAHWDPAGFYKEISSYNDYDGGENTQSILEGLREQYILGKVLEEIDQNYQCIIIS